MNRNTSNAIRDGVEIRPASVLPKSGRPLKGWHVLAIALGAFAVILTANVAMIASAVGSFPGVVSKNSYVASQEFNKKAAERARLGWSLTVSYDDGALRVRALDAAGEPISGLTVGAQVGLSVDGRTDRQLLLEETSDGYAAPIALAPGQWRVAVEAQAANGEQMGGETALRIR
ncbi:MAG: FixH family protein [Pseudomonadota bacterium]